MEKIIGTLLILSIAVNLHQWRKSLTDRETLNILLEKFVLACKALDYYNEKLANGKDLPYLKPFEQRTKNEQGN